MSAACMAASTTLPVTLVFAAIVLGSIYFLYTTAKTELAPQEDQGVIITQSIAAPDATLQQRQLYSQQVYKTFAAHPENEHVFQLDVPGQSIAGMVLQPWDMRTLTTNQLQPRHAAGAQPDRRRTHRRVSAAAAARQHRSAGAVRDRHDRAVPAPQRGRPAVPAGGLEERHVHFPRLRPQGRQSAGQCRHRSRQDRAARIEDERCRWRARLPAGRRLRQLFQHERAFLQGHSAGAAALSPERTAIARLLHPHRRRHAGAAVDHRQHLDHDGAGIAQPFSAAQ